MDFIKPHNKHPVIDHLNVYSAMNTPSNTKYMYVQCNEYSLWRINTPSEDHPKLNCTMNNPSEDHPILNCTMNTPSKEH